MRKGVSLKLRNESEGHVSARGGDMSERASLIYSQTVAC